MNLKNPKIQKLVSALIIISMLTPSILLFSIPKKANAFLGIGDVVVDILTEIGVGRQVAVDIKNTLQEVVRQMSMRIAKRMLADITKRTVGWISTGHFGSPLFLENPKSFFKDIAKSEVKDLINVIGYDPARFPFGKQQALGIINSYKRQLSDNASYSLSNVVNDPSLLYNYQNNFSYGGWNAFVINTQYPQNNYPGSQMQINSELARRLAGTSQNVAQTVNTTLQQGQGFLSPQTCPSNPNYPKAVNPYDLPTFKFTPPADLTPPIPAMYDGGINDPDYIADKAEYDKTYTTIRGIDKRNWERKYNCPNGLVTTTPGSVVASSVMDALGAGQKLTELQAAVGGSLSAIFDAVLNKFLGSGLTSLASNANPYTPPDDNFDYLGNTLGSSPTNINGTYSGDVFSGPDEEIDLIKFKDEVATGIANTQEELTLMDSSNPNNFGITQFFSLIWPKMRELDICLPGPDLGWEVRLENERDRNSKKFQEKLSDSNGQTAAKAQLADNELKFAVDFFKDWVTTKIMASLPGAIVYMDAVNEVETFEQESKELTDKRRSKAQTLARLQAIQTSLASFTSQPLAGTESEKGLIAIKKQYNAIFYLISNATTMEETNAQLDTAKDKYDNLLKLVGQCTNERKAAKWTIPNGNWADTLTNGFKSILPSAAGKQAIVRVPAVFSSGTVQIITTGEEQEQFCNVPIVSGYTHPPFIQKSPVPPEYSTLPLVNATNVSYKGSGFLSSGTTNVTISCNLIYRANVLDYKRNILSAPGLPPEPVQPPPPPDDTGDTDTSGTNNNTNPPVNNGNNNNPPSTCGDTGQPACS